MKKTSIRLILAIGMLASMSSCATVFGGPITSYQKTKPMTRPREVRTGALIADILLFWPGAIVDFATGAIYKPR
jgi:hypothetical protein